MTLIMSPLTETGGSASFEGFDKVKLVLGSTKLNKFLCPSKDERVSCLSL